MSTQITINSFEKFYNDTYKKVLKFTICQCKDLDDVNDIIQEIYTELYERIIKKKSIDLDNVEAYVIGIASNKIKRHYSGTINREVKNISINDIEIESFEDKNFNIEEDLITKDNIEQTWKFIRNKGEITSKIFYLFYVLEVSIKEISNGLKISESNIKNHLYRTQKELKNIFKNGEDAKCLVKK